MTNSPATHHWPPRESETDSDADGRVVRIRMFRIYGGANEMFLCDRCGEWVLVSQKDRRCTGRPQ